MLRINKMRLPTCEEYDLLATTTKEDNDTMHWSYMYSWCQDEDQDSMLKRAVRGYLSARYWNGDNATNRNVHVGFRPAFEVLHPDPLTPDGTIITVGTLYMDGKPVRVSKDPTKDGTVPDYIPGASLEMREALDDPDYQVQAIKAGDVLIADRVLLKNISWNDTQDALRPEQTETQDTQKALNPGKMRLPTCEEYDLLVTAVKEDNSIMHWEKISSWCQDVDQDRASYRAIRGYHSARVWDNYYATNRSAVAGFRPVIEILNPKPLVPDGVIITVGTLYMDGKPVKVPQNPTQDGDIPNYIHGAKLEMREALDDPSYQVQAIKIGNVLIADRVLLKKISWDDTQNALSSLALGKMRLPTCGEYNLLATATKEDNSLLHWKKMYSWCQDVDPDRAPHRVIWGNHSAHYWSNNPVKFRHTGVGFRPAFEILNPDSLTPDGTIITVGTLYMDGKPVKVPQNPTQNGDVSDYIPGAKLEMREALDDPSYQVKAIKADDVLVADRVLLKNISWNDTQDALRPEQTETQDTQKALNPGKMRLPTCEEYDLLATTAKENNDTMHWNDMFSWCQDVSPEDVSPDWASLRAVRGWVSAHHWGCGTTTNRNAHVGFRPAFEILNPDSLTPDGATIMIGTLYMDDKPVKVPQNPVFHGDIPDYIPGAKLEMREPLDDPSYQVRAIKAGNVLISDRVLLKNISWNDTQYALRAEQTETQDTQKALNPGKMRLPTCEEYDFLATAVKEDNDTMHWAGIFSLCQDANPDWTLTRAVRGYRSARHWSSSYAAHRNVSAGFRPAIENLTPGPLPPDGTIITVGTFYMNGQPVKVPQNPTRDGDIPDYIPGAKLEMREALDDPSYQVQAIKAGDVLIVDRVLLKNISWDDLNDKILEGESTMKTNTSVICLDDEVFGACAIACSQANEDKVRSFFVKRYPVWAAKCKGKVGMTPWNNIVDALRDMKELLDDENLRFLGGCAITRFPNQG